MERDARYANRSPCIAAGAAVTYRSIKSGVLKTTRDGLSQFEPTPAVAPSNGTKGQGVEGQGVEGQGVEGLGYPLRTIVVLATVLALVVLWMVLQVSQTSTLLLSAGVGLLAVAFVGLRTRQRTLAGSQNAHVLAALGAVTSEIPVRLRANMPLAVVVGDSLPAIFDRAGEARFVHVGDGAIWIRADRLQDLPSLSAAVRQWRNGRAPDGFVLSVAPASHSDVDTLTQRLRVMRQALADASRMLGARLPAYLAVYQRVTPDQNSNGAADATIDETAGANAAAVSKTTLFAAIDSGSHSSEFAPGLTAALWYGVSSATRLFPRGQGAISAGTQTLPAISAAGLFEPIVKAAEANALSTGTQQAASIHPAVTRAAALTSLIGWTRRIVIETLTDHRQPSAPCALYGVGWIDCGPAAGRGKPWELDVESQTAVVPATVSASPSPWPLPQPLIEAMPQQRWVSPRLAALAHAFALTACAAAVAFWGAASNNAALIDRIGADLQRYAMIPAARDAAKRDALQALVADRDQLEHYARLGIPLHLSFGMYRGAQLMPVLNNAIATYQPPAAPPLVVTLDSMSLFDSGNAQLKPGSTRAMVSALEMIRSNPGKRILVAGHTDAIGTPDSNLRLSIARAAAVRDWLIDASGMHATQFAIQGYGDTRPIASNDAPEGRAKNRRVEITLVPETVP
jgi:outer membrane protein OmpA-like peptidoglycan-associated protein